MSSPTPLPELETQLVDAARRLDAGEAAAPAAPRRRWWRHGSTLIAIGAVGLGTGVAVARVAEIGPFAYLNRYTGGNPNLQPKSIVTVEPAGAAPAWQARAVVNGLGQLCITGGPRDPRTNPLAKPTKENLNNPPSTGMTCSDSEESAQTLVDPEWPGATFAGSTPLDAGEKGGLRVIKKRGGYATAPPAKVLVYAVAEAKLTPVVRWGAHGAPIPMQPSKDHLRLKIDKSPRGLSAEERELVATYPSAIDLRLWATEVDVPKGVDHPQVAFPAEMPPHGVDDSTVEMIGDETTRAIFAEGRRRGWKYVRHISRDPKPVEGVTEAQRKWIAAFARKRTADDAVPGRLRTEQEAYARVQFAATRRLSIVGGGVERAWIAPGGIPDYAPLTTPIDQLCMVGAPILGRCKNGAYQWREPVIEAVVCSPSLSAAGQTLVWGLAPPGATGVELSGPGTRTERLKAAELLAVRRSRDERISAVTWTWPDGRRTRIAVPWPKRTPACGKRSPGWSSYRVDSARNSSMSGGPRSPRGR